MIYLIRRKEIEEKCEGTLWHVFDYNSTTGRITLFNEFSYEKDPRDVGQDRMRM